MRALAYVLLLVPGLARAEPVDVSVLLEPIREEHRLPALAGAILVGSEVTMSGATGVRRVGSSEAVTTRDHWHLGSCTKAMTATLIARLVERGVIGWDTRVGGVLEELRVHPDYRDVTVEQLLSHRAGTPAPEADLARPIWSWLWTHRGSIAEERLAYVRETLRESPREPPGTAYRYSNAGYVIAGAMAEQATGRSWEQLIRDEVFTPLGMREIGFGAPGNANALDQPWGHTKEGRPVEPGEAADNPPAIGPAGTVHATLETWSRFVAAHLEVAVAPDGYLSRESFAKLHTSIEGQEYALGWIAVERPWGDGRVLTHNGSNTMWYVTVWMAPRRGFAVLVATNQGGDRAAKGTDAAAWALIQRHLRAR